MDSETPFRVVTGGAAIGLALLGAATMNPVIGGLGVVAFIGLIGQEIISRRNRKKAEAAELARHREVIGQVQSLQQVVTKVETSADEKVRQIERGIAVLLPRIEILDPREGNAVEFRQTVRGTVRPLGTPLQLLLLAGGNWYPQWSVKMDGERWTAMCQFGSQGSKAGGRYRLMAISGARIEKATPENGLPDNIVRSQPVNVVRK